MRKALLLIFISIYVSIAYGQKAKGYTNPEKLFYEGKELYDLQQYSAAFQHFEEYMQTLDKDRSQLYAETEYYLASCAYELSDKTARKRFEKFKTNNPASTFNNRTAYLSGSLNYQKGSYEEAAQDFLNCDAKFLNNEERSNLLFRNGYSLLQCKEIDKAKVAFSSLLEDSTKYNESAAYYRAYIDYVQKDYESALPIFLSLQENTNYKAIIPYYIFQIYYAKKDYDAVLETGENLLKKDPKNKNNAEIHRILGECYYGKQDYNNTIKYLSIYEKESKQVLRNNMYMLGISYYQTGNYKNAINSLQKVTSIEDALAQNAYLYLGASYIKENNKNNARLCFESAGRMDFEKNIKEEALYNYALTVYEQSYSPFNESITAFEGFLNEFPKSRYTDKVYNYMVNLYLTTKNYQEAYESIERIKEKNIQIYEARQRILYSIGIQYFTAGEYEKAIDAFTKSIADGKYNRTTEASTIFWRGEAYYKLKNFDKSAADFELFVNSVGARNCKEFNLAHYNVGYSFFTNKNYDAALTWFRKYVNMEESNKTLIADANNRIGDCYFYNRNFENAVKSYDVVYNMRGPGADYACFQEAFIDGLRKNYDKKIETLNKLLKSFPQSEYIADAKYEIGRSYIMLGKNQEAINIYESLQKDYPHSPLSRKGRLQTAMLYEEINNYDKAISIYKEIVDYFPNSVEAKTSLESMKTIYFEQNNVQGYADYVATLNGLATFEVSEQDSLTYLAAERQFLKEEYQQAITSFNNYLTKFPEGGFAYNVRFDLANSYFNLGDKENARNQYSYIASQIGSPNREESLVKLSEIQYDMHDYENAIASMISLADIAQNAENKQAAKIGILRCNSMMGKLDETIAAANELAESDKLDPSIQREAIFTRAKTYELKNDSAKALTDYLLLAENCLDQFGAEAKYRIAEYFYLKGDLASSEKEIFEFIEKNTPHQYWLAKSFILLSDVYVKQGKDFEAKQYLMSVRENYKGKDDIAAEIKMRLAEIENREFDKIVNE